jgi:hypothetical protein
MKTVSRWAIGAVVLSAASLGLTTAAFAQCAIPTGLFAFDFSDNQYLNCFRDLVRGGGINAGLDQGGTEHTALNITGSGGAAGATWLTVVDQDPSTPAADNLFGSAVLCADVLIQPFNNAKGAGLVALLNEGAGQKGLALILYDAGNTDSLELATVEGDPAQRGRLTRLASLPLGSQIAENAWYRVVMTVLVDGPPQITGQVFRHTTPSDPNSGLVALPGTLSYSPGSLPAGVSALGQEGVIGASTSAVVNSSVTNFTNVAGNCQDSTSN